MVINVEISSNKNIRKEYEKPEKNQERETRESVEKEGQVIE